MLVLFTALVSGFSIFINSFGVKGFDSSVFTFSKNILVAVFLISVLIGLGQWKELRSLTSKQWSQLILIGAVGGSIPFLLFFKGLQMTAGTTSAFLHKTLFIYASLFALIFLKERLTKGLLIGALLLLAGNYLMLKPSFNFSSGHLLVIFATMFWGAENTIAKHVLKELSGTLVAFGRMFFGSSFIFFFLLVTGKAPLVLSMSTAQYQWIIITSLFLFLYVFSYYHGLKHIKVSTATSILVLGSPITTALNFLVKGTPVTIETALGMSLILMGIVSIAFFSRILSFLSFGGPTYGRH